MTVEDVVFRPATALQGLVERLHIERLVGEHASDSHGPRGGAHEDSGSEFSVRRTFLNGYGDRPRRGVFPRWMKPLRSAGTSSPTTMRCVWGALAVVEYANSSASLWRMV